MLKKILHISLLVLTSSLANASDLISLSFDGKFDVRYNCEKRGYETFSYNAVEDGGSLSRYQPFSQDKRLPEHCQQFKTGTYKTSSEDQYDRGHGVHQNIWDHDIKLMKLTNLMSNIIPQERRQNRYGLWRYTEKLTECHREVSDVYVLGGNIWGDDTSNDHFLASHGVVTPDHLFKIIIINEDVYAWIIKNDNYATTKNANEHLVSILEIESRLGYSLDEIDESYKHTIAKDTPRLVKGCSLK
jgi:endonuclease G